MSARTSARDSLIGARAGDLRPLVTKKLRKSTTATSVPVLRGAATTSADPPERRYGRNDNNNTRSDGEKLVDDRGFNYSRALILISAKLLITLRLICGGLDHFVLPRCPPNIESI